MKIIYTVYVYTVQNNLLQVKVQHLSKENVDLQSEMTTLQGEVRTLREEKSGLQHDNESHISEVKRLQVLCV